MRSCSSAVLIEEAAEPIAAAKLTSLTFAVVDKDPEHTLQVPSPDDQQPVKALGADRADPVGARKSTVGPELRVRRATHRAT
jgi:hypothetical protein